VEGKYVVKEMGENEVVILDVPAGRLRVSGGLDESGEEGVMVFSIAEHAETPGSRPKDAGKVPAVKIAVHGVASAMAIARAFADMAHAMVEISCGLDDEDDDFVEEVDEEDVDEADGDEDGDSHIAQDCSGFCCFCDGCGADED